MTVSPTILLECGISTRKFDFTCIKLVIQSKGIVLKVPTPQGQNDIRTIIIEKKHIVKVLVNFQKTLPVVFYYVVPSVGQLVREQLGMTERSKLYFKTFSTEGAYRRITILPENVSEDTKTVFKQGLSKVMASTSGYNEIKHLLNYPPGKGGLPINTEDYLCLAQGQFLNDAIINFYLKYLVLNLPREQQEKVHVFSTFFYTRLTTKPVKASRLCHSAELDPTLSPAQKQHARVERWTKDVNLFEKDYIIIPINENFHWFLAIVCFPGIDGCVTLDEKPALIEPRQKKKNTTTIGNVTITTIKQEANKKEISCELDSEEDSEESEPAEPIEPPPVERKEKGKRQQIKQPIKQPCVLIFDSLAGASRSGVMTTLRDYLACEYTAKMGAEKIFNKDVIKGSCLKVPQQTNFTDCGLYLLQYVEQFFKDPIHDYRIPIKQVIDWFDEFVVTRKREDISILIKELMDKYGKDPSSLPNIAFPTLNGKLVIHKPEPIIAPTTSKIRITFKDSRNEKKLPISDIKLSPESVKQRDDFLEQAVPNASLLKPNVSELRNQSSRHTLSYLKGKRINTHKHTDAVDVKKCKPLSD